MNMPASSPPSPPGKRPRILLISQVFPPDPTAVGQYLADAAEALVQRGYDVRVLTSARGFDDPTARYPARERRGGVEIIRLPFSSFGKKTIAHRLVGMVTFLTQVLVRGLFTPRLRGILVSTSPPLASFAAVLIGFLRRSPITYWAMDINPDQMVALGRLDPKALSVRAFDAFNRLILRRAASVVALDRFMGDRLCAKYDISEKLLVMPPWPHGEHQEPVPHDENPFRKKHGLQGKFVVMYSGNHALTNPIDTLIETALRMQNREDLVFLFVGGGVRKQEVDEAIAKHQPTNLLSLPYQPREQTRWSLSAADVHVVTLGDSVVGIVHPCKVYGAMALGRPLLYFGPNPSHVSDLLEEENPKKRIGWSLHHGDVEAAIATMDKICQMPNDELQAMGDRAAQVVRERFDSAKMIDRFCTVTTRGVSALKE